MGSILMIFQDEFLDSYLNVFRVSLDFPEYLLSILPGLSLMKKIVVVGKAFFVARNLDIPTTRLALISVMYYNQIKVI